MNSRLMIFAALALGGCVTVDPGAAQRIAETIPTCRAAEECEIKWAAARTWVLNNADMKIQTYSSDFLQTYNPSETGPELAASVNKEPMQGGGYRLVAKLWCNNPFGCTKAPQKMLQSFNDHVNAATPSAP